MKIKIQQFLFGQSHSWAYVGKDIARTLISKNNDVHLLSTDGIKEELCNLDLRSSIRNFPDAEYDCQISYTAPVNFKNYFNNGSKNRFAIWNYEWPILPPGFAKSICSNNIDKFLPSSPFFYDICVENGIPKEKMELIRHGIDSKKFLNATPMKLNTEKKIKFFINVAQVHARKNLEGTLNAFGEAFNKNDDVCLVIKTTDHKPKYPFELFFNDVYNKFNKKFPNHAECLILKDFIPKIEELYAAIDILYMLPSAECFFLPALEALAAKKTIITSNYGGPVEGKKNKIENENQSFLNNDNSYLISGKKVRCPKNYQYWSSNVMNSHFEPNYIETVEVLQKCVNDFDNKKIISDADYIKIMNEYSWDTQVDKILKICK